MEALSKVILFKYLDDLSDLVKAMLLPRSFYFMTIKLIYLYLANVGWITVQSREISHLEISPEY